MAFSRFTLNTSALDDATVGLDGSPFPMNATAQSGLDELIATATATIVNSTSAMAVLEGASASATSLVIKL